MLEFDEQSFLNLKAIICRPGLGIITDSVIYSTPIAAVVEPDNSEMAHNSRCIVKYNFGTAIELHSKNKAEIFYRWLHSENILLNYQSLLKEKGAGDRKAAEIIMSTLIG